MLIRELAVSGGIVAAGTDAAALADRLFELRGGHERLGAFVLDTGLDDDLDEANAPPTVPPSSAPPLEEFIEDVFDHARREGS